jgi:hypothetical protein
MTSSPDPLARPLVARLEWQSVGAIKLDALARARSEAINLAQWLARIANSFVIAGTAQERLMLEFRPADAAFGTKKFASGLSIEMRLPSLELQFREDGKPVPHVFDPEGRSPAEVEAWLLVELLHRGLDRAKFSKKLPYKVPGLMSGDAEDHSPQSNQPALAQLTAWFRNAAAALMRAAGAERAAICCWPQTLSLSTASNIGSTDFGFTPGDAQIPEPYFYRSLGVAKGSTASKARSVLTASALLAESDPAAAAIAFMNASK